MFYWEAHMYTLTKATVITAVIQSALMAAIFVRGNPNETFVPLLILSALAHSTVFVLFTRELAALSIKEKHSWFWVELALAALTAITCAVFGIQLQADLHNGKIIPNGDIASYGLFVMSTSLLVTILCFFTFITNSDETMAEIRSDLDTDRQPLT